MEKLKSILTSITMLIALNASSQNNNLEEVVHLKNGSIIHGIIIEQVPNQSVKIETHDGNIFVYKMEEIEKITKESPQNSRINSQKDYRIKSTEDKKISSKKESDFNPHYTFIAEGGYFFGIGEVTTDEDLTTFDPNTYSAETITLNNEDGGYSLRTVHAYQTSNNFSIGAGIGIDIYKFMVLMPLTIDARLSFGKSDTRPFVNMGFGHSVALNAETGGFNFNIGFGVKTASSWAFNLNYRIQSSPFVFQYMGDEYLVNGTGKYIAISSSYYF